MALSEHEQRLLAEMEAALEQDDPRLVSTMTGKARTRQGSRILLGGTLVLGGMAILLAGLVAQFIPVGLVGFLVALTGAVVMISNFARPSLGKSSHAPKPKKTPWTSRLEERWDRRNFDN